MQQRITVDQKKVGSPRQIWIIENNLCDGILPYSCYYDGEGFVGNYNAEGYIKLRNLKMVSGQDALTILESIIRAFNSLREYLFFPEDLIISPDTVFIKENYTKACLIMVGNDSPLRESRYFEIMIGYLKTKTNSLGGDYLEKALTFMDSNPKYQRLIMYIEGLKTDLSYFETK